MEAGKAGNAGKRPVLQILPGKAGKHVPFTTTKAGKAGKCIFQSRKKSFSSVFDYYVSNHFVLLFYYYITFIFTKSGTMYLIFSSSPFSCFLAHLV